jgi:hypothetical protein
MLFQIATRMTYVGYTRKLDKTEWREPVPYSLEAEIGTVWFIVIHYIWEERENRLALLLHILGSLIQISARIVTILRPFRSFTQSTEESVGMEC